MVVFALDTKDSFPTWKERIPMSKVYRFILAMVVLANLAFSTAFTYRSVPQLQSDCGLFSLLVTVFTNRQPCGFGKTEVFHLVTNYVENVVTTISEIPKSSFFNTDKTIPLIVPSTTPAFAATATDVPIVNSATRIKAFQLRVKNNNTPIVINTKVEPVATENVSVINSPTNDFEPTETMEPTNTSIPPTETLVATPEPIQDTPTDSLPTPTEIPVAQDTITAP